MYHLPMLKTRDILQSPGDNYILGAHTAYDGNPGKQKQPVSAAFPSVVKTPSEHLA